MPLALAEIARGWRPDLAARAGARTAVEFRAALRPAQAQPVFNYRSDGRDSAEDTFAQDIFELEPAKGKIKALAEKVWLFARQRMCPAERSP
jgi:hypothetical protein